MSAGTTRLISVNEVLELSMNTAVLTNCQFYINLHILTS
jgi:hypothetical protein